MPRNLNADSVLRNLSDDEKVAVLAFFYDSWSEITRIGIDPDPECDRLGVDREAFASAASKISGRWNGAN